MKKHITLFTILIALAAPTLFAAQAPFSTDSAVAQSYHATTSSSAQNQLATIADNSDANSSAAVINTAGVNLTQPVQDPAAEMSPTSSSFQQQTDQHIQNLDHSNQAMGTVLTTLEQTVVQLQQQVDQLSAQSAASHHKQSSFFQNEVDVTISVLLAAIVLIGFGMMIGKRVNRRVDDTFLSQNTAQNIRHKNIVTEDDTNNEYDFMSTAQAIPAKLDLARSYMVMNDFDQAREVLKTVLEKGNEEQRSEAMSLIQKMQKK